jgi:hypothetical protein
MPRSHTAKQYLTRAKHCIGIAEGMDLPARLILLQIAQAWMRLAEQVDRDESLPLTLVLCLSSL